MEDNSDNVFSFTADENDTGIRLDKLIADKDFAVSRSRAAHLIEEGLITVNGKKTDKKAAVEAGDIVTVTIPETIPAEILPEDIPLDIVYEDSDLIVVNKPKGMVVHPAPGNPDKTLVNALLFHVLHADGQLSGINGVIRPGIVHRIDKNTSGLLVAAKTDRAHNALAAQIKEHSFTREYLCVCMGGFRDDTGVIEAPIGRNPHDRKKMCVINDPRYSSRPAKTEYTVLDSHDGYSFLRLKLYTGRTHQIRVHLSSINHPVFGDDVYGKASPLCAGQCLHAAKLGFLHPTTGEYTEFTAPLPEYFTKVLDRLKLSSL
jgi:23S rRNA pseudouridine1911/1915/1917 synthase